MKVSFPRAPSVVHVQKLLQGDPLWCRVIAPSVIILSFFLCLPLHMIFLLPFLLIIFFSFSIFSPFIRHVPITYFVVGMKDKGVSIAGLCHSGAECVNGGLICSPSPLLSFLLFNQGLTPVITLRGTCLNKSETQSPFCG